VRENEISLPKLCGDTAHFRGNTADDVVLRLPGTIRRMSSDTCTDHHGVIASGQYRNYKQ